MSLSGDPLKVFSPQERPISGDAPFQTLFTSHVCMIAPLIRNGIPVNPATYAGTKPAAPIPDTKYTVQPTSEVCAIDFEN